MTPIEKMEAALRKLRGIMIDSGYIGNEDEILLIDEALREWEAVKNQVVLVPVEPTQMMCNAAIDTHPFELGDISPIGLRISPQKLFAECYKAMIAAAQNTEAEGE